MVVEHVPSACDPGYAELSKMSEFFQRLKSSLHNGLEFIRDTRKELKNVSWPGRREVTGTTLVVIAAVFFFGFFLWVVDTLVYFGLNRIGLFRSAL
jgi:preprotein translocase subunit SecE